MAKRAFQGPLERINDHCWRIPKSYKPGMRVDGRIYCSAAMLESIRGDQAPEQVANVAFLPGIQGASLAMPDIHWGYGFTIGGVCATDPDEGGVISPGGSGLRHQLRCAAGADQPAARRGATSGAQTGRGVVPAGAAGRGTRRCLSLQQAGVEAADDRGPGFPASVAAWPPNAISSTRRQGGV